MTDLTAFAKRRKSVFSQMTDDSVAILFSGSEIERSPDIEYLFHVNKDFYYLTGLNEPDSVCVLLNKEKKCILFVRPRDLEKEIWNGKRTGVEGAKEVYGADEAYSIEHFTGILADLLLDKDKIYYAYARDAVFEEQISYSINKLRGKIRSGVRTPLEIVNIDKILHEMRMVKSADEVSIMRQACEISARAHTRVMKMCRPGLWEYELEAELMYEFYKSGSHSQAYNNIVASGPNSCILHYRENSRQTEKGDIVLIDAGCEYQFYASDITRTFPVNGKFSKEQQAIYELVLAVNKHCISQVKPGITRDVGQNTAIKLLTEGLVELGLLKGQVDDLISEQAYRQFYMHQLSHWIGLDAHDVGIYKLHDGWRTWDEGMAFTVEPGLYISPAKNVDEKWWHIGVRIEDNIIVTKNGCDVLTSHVVKEVDDIEALMKQ